MSAAGRGLVPDRSIRSPKCGLVPNPDLRTAQAPSSPRTYAAWPRCWLSSLTTLTSRTPRVTGGSQRSSTTRSRSSAASAREVADRLLVHGREVRRQQVGVGAHLRHVGAGVAVADVAGVEGQVEAVARSPRAVHTCSSAGDVGDVVVLHPGEVPDQPGDRVGVRAGPVGELVVVEAVDDGGAALDDALEGVGQQLVRESCIHRRTGTDGPRRPGPPGPGGGPRDELRLHPDDRAGRSARAGALRGRAPRRSASTSR